MSRPLLLNLLAAALATCGACGPASRGQPPVIGEPVIAAAALSTVLRADEGRGTVEVEYRNEGWIAAQISEQVIGSNVLALGVQDEAGKKQGTVPPPTAWGQGRFVTIPAGGVERRSYSYAPMSDPPLTPGRYWLYSRVWPGRPVPFTVGR